jgi:hypothetical protein
LVAGGKADERLTQASILTNSMNTLYWSWDET